RHAAMKFDRHRVFANGLDRLRQLNAAAGYGEVLRLQRFSDVRGGDGSVERVLPPDAPRDLELERLEPLRKRVGNLALLRLARLSLCPLAFDLALVLGGDG